VQPVTHFVRRTKSAIVIKVLLIAVLMVVLARLASAAGPAQAAEDKPDAIVPAPSP
jgi:hypothetical protein